MDGEDGATSKADRGRRSRGRRRRLARKDRSVSELLVYAGPLVSSGRGRRAPRDARHARPRTAVARTAEYVGESVEPKAPYTCIYKYVYVHRYKSIQITVDHFLSFTKEWSWLRLVLGSVEQGRCVRKQTLLNT